MFKNRHRVRLRFKKIILEKPLLIGLHCLYCTWKLERSECWTISHPVLSHFLFLRLSAFFAGSSLFSLRVHLASVYRPWLASQVFRALLHLLPVSPRFGTLLSVGPAPSRPQGRALLLQPPRFRAAGRGGARPCPARPCPPIGRAAGPTAPRHCRR